MPTVTLLEKVYGSFSPEALEPTLKPMVEDLNVRFEIKKRTIQEWVQVEVSGEDETVALQLLNREFGLAPTSMDKVQKFSLLRGRIIGSSRAMDELRVDVGVVAPKSVYATVSLSRLQAQLADGQKLPIQSMIELYCLHDYMPLQIKIVNTELTNFGYFEAELSEHQLRLFTGWLRESLDRLMIVGARLQDVDQALRISKHLRDVARIDSLGLLEHALVCKLGTDAVGLIPALGRQLRKATFAPFSPRKMQQAVHRPIL